VTHVRICIVGYRNLGDVNACLGALALQTHDDFEIVICENGGPEAVGALMSALPDTLASGQALRIVSDHSNPGYAEGVNRCIEADGSAEAYWVLNPDTLPQPGALAAMVMRLQAGDVDAVGGQLLNPDGTLGSCGGQWISLLAYARSIGLGRPASEAPSQKLVESRMRFISGASMLCSRHFVEIVGPMRGDYFLYCEEVEWCLRARKRGMRLGHTSQARVLHHQGSSTGSGKAVSDRGRLPVYCNERNRILTLRDTRPELLVPGAIGALAMIFYFYGKRRAWTQMGIAVGAWRDGVMNRRGKPDWI
jgi:N-acetylglucosaminyl-diphospho-decaprenol L-rhamnosyltransferase